jgi:hypothetical protein
MAKRKASAQDPGDDRKELFHRHGVQGSSLAEFISAHNAAQDRVGVLDEWQRIALRLRHGPRGRAGAVTLADLAEQLINRITWARDCIARGDACGACVAGMAVQERIGQIKAIEAWEPLVDAARRSRQGGRSKLGKDKLSDQEKIALRARYAERIAAGDAVKNALADVKREFEVGSDTTVRKYLRQKAPF